MEGKKQAVNFFDRMRDPSLSTTGIRALGGVFFFTHRYLGSNRMGKGISGKRPAFFDKERIVGGVWVKKNVY